MIIGIGIDLIEVKRIKGALKHPRNNFLKRVFTAGEKSCAQSRGKTKAEHLAARFAAKEAFLKAIQTGWGTRNSPLWQEIQVKTRAHGQPYLVLSGKAKRIAKQLKINQTLLSLSHTKDYAIAIVILEH